MHFKPQLSFMSSLCEFLQQRVIVNLFLPVVTNNKQLPAIYVVHD